MAIEEEFYRVFGIKKQKYYACKDEHYNDVFDVKYPPITDRILLELICIASSIYPITINRKETYHELKDFILGFFVRHRYNKEMSFKQIRSLFEVEE